MKPPKIASLALLITFWALAVATGMGLLLRYSNAPAADSSSPHPTQDPNPSPTLSHAPFHLLLFAHPQCPCTLATLTELAKLLALTGPHLDTHVYFFCPTSRPDFWAHSDLWSQAQAIPGVQVSIDPNGALAARYAAATSGTILLYDQYNKLRFSGGITFARGHEGDNAGEQAILDITRQGTSTCQRTPVFGCSILTPQCTTSER